jgi:hypothetical protein
MKSGKHAWTHTAHLKCFDKTYRFSSFEEMYRHFRQRLGVEDRRREEVMRRCLDAAAHDEQEECW